MKVLFLDVDGVLNYDGMPGKWPWVVCPERAARVVDVCAATGTEIVLSSSWRGHKSGERKLRASGVKFKSRTPRLWHKNRVRGDEIALWLAEHPEVTKYAIVDDDSDMLEHQRPYFVQTHWAHGLLTEDAERLMWLLI